jgi:hypothetical protein
METVQAIAVADIRDIPFNVFDVVIRIFFDLIRKELFGRFCYRMDHPCRFQLLCQKALPDIRIPVALPEQFILVVFCRITPVTVTVQIVSAPALPLFQ